MHSFLCYSSSAYDRLPNIASLARNTAVPARSCFRRHDRCRLPNLTTRPGASRFPGVGSAQRFTVAALVTHSLCESGRPRSANVSRHSVADSVHCDCTTSQVVRDVEQHRVLHTLPAVRIEALRTRYPLRIWYVCEPSACVAQARRA